MISEGHSLDSAITATWQIQQGTREHSIAKIQFESWQRGEQPQPIDLSKYEEES
jgi:hypothetical protein